MTHYADYRANRTFGSLDGLRALAILAVVWHHAGPRYAWVATERGFLGVDLFFVISGFLIVTLLLRERDANGAIVLPSFYMRRFLRIFPLYYGALALYWSVAQWKGGVLAEGIAHDLPYAATYVSNWVPMSSLLVITWSLSAEEQFYLVWPAVEKLGARAACWLLGAGLAACVTLQLLSHAAVLEGWPDFLGGSSFTPILIGVALAHAMHAPAGFARVRRWLGGAAAAPISLGLLTALCSIPNDRFGGVHRVATAVACGVLVAACVVREDNGLARLLRRRWVARLGVVSYGVYLLHEIPGLAVTYATRRLQVNAPWLEFFVVWGVAWCLAEFSYRTYERFFLRLKARWSVAGS